MATTIGALEIEMAANIARLSADLGAARAEVNKTMGDIQRSVASMQEGIQSGMGSVTAAFGKVNVAIAAVTTALAGGAAFKSAVEETVNMTKEANALGKSLGISATEASVLNIALGDIYQSSDTMLAANKALTKQLIGNEGAFKELGVATRDQNGHYRNSLDIMLEVNQCLLGFKEGTDRNIEGMKVYGKAWGEVSGILKLNTDLMEASRAKARELGLMVGAENVEATARYRAAMNDVGDVISAIRKTIGDAMLPKLTEMANWFANVGPQAVEVMRTIMQSWLAVSAIFLSPVVDAQKSAAEWITQWLKACNSTVIFSDGVLKFIPYGDEAVTGNGATFTPSLTPLYDLTDDDFIGDTGSDPVIVTRTPQSDAFNRVQIEFSSRANNYNPEIAEAKDQANIEAYGLRPNNPVKIPEICTLAVARHVAQLILQRGLYVRNHYEFRLPWKYALLEPMDIVTLTDSGLGLDREPVRIISIEEDAEGLLTVIAEELPIGVAGAAKYVTQGGTGFQLDYNAAPGNANAPVIFEAPDLLTAGSGLEIWIATSGSANWGGYEVWVSRDNATYQKVGEMHGKARHGVLSAAMATGGDTDTLHSLAVDTHAHTRNRNHSAPSLSNPMRSDFQEGGAGTELKLGLCPSAADGRRGSGFIFGYLLLFRSGCAVRPAPAALPSFGGSRSQPFEFLFHACRSRQTV